MKSEIEKHQNNHGVGDAHAIIHNMPTADVVEVKRGEWEVYKDCEGKTRVITCNLCGWESGMYTWHNYNFCPNCGARIGDSNG